LQPFAAAGEVAPEAEGASAYKSLLAGTALGCLVAFASAAPANAESAFQKNAREGKPIRVRDAKTIKEAPQYDAWVLPKEIVDEAKKKSAKLNGYTFSADNPKKYRESSLGTGTYLKYNMAWYQDLANYRGTVKDDGKQIFPQDNNNIQRKALRKQAVANLKEKGLLLDKGKYATDFSNSGPYKPRLYTSQYEKMEGESIFSKW